MAEIASVFDCHHIVNIRYPSSLELRSEDEELALTTPLNYTTRFDPNVPLVADTSVEHNAGRQSDAETSFYSITPAVFRTPEQWAAQDLGDEVRLLHDMQLATGGNGVTDLFVVTFSVPRPAQIEGDEHPDGVDTGSSQSQRRGDHGNGGDEIDGCDAMIRIWRNTQLPPIEHEGGMFSIRIVHDEYTMTTAVFDAIESDALWLVNIQDLVHGRSDRAVKHAALQLQRSNTDNPPVSWKPQRCPRFEGKLAEVSKSIDFEALASMLDVEDRYCAVCKEDYDSEIQPLALHNSSHLICNQCLLTWCREQGSEVCCPHCRQELITDEATLAWLKFGVQDKTYEYDDRYDAWENYSRSCADLDKHLALNNPTEITVHRDIALSAWDDIIAHELLESPESTPYHLQPARSPEYNLLRATIENSLDSLNGTSGLTLIVYHALQKDLCQALARASLRGGVALGLSAVSRRELLRDPIGIGRTDGPGGFWEYGLMPGFMEFAKRSLSRMLQFLSLRVCRCGEGAGHAFHQHGLRKYYSLGEPEKEKGEVEKVTAELGKSSLAEDEEGPCEAWASSMEL